MAKLDKNGWVKMALCEAVSIRNKWAEKFSEAGILGNAEAIRKEIEKMNDIDHEEFYEMLEVIKMSDYKGFKSFAK